MPVGYAAMGCRGLPMSGKVGVGVTIEKARSRKTGMCKRGRAKVRTMDHTTIKKERQRRAEARVTELNRLADHLLEQTEGTDASTADLLRNEATRLFGLCHEITAVLARGDISKAYRLSAGDDVGGTSLGLTA